MANTELPIFVVADDLTGAIDTGIYFRGASRRVRVGLDASRPWNLGLPTSFIQVYDSETRILSPSKARDQVFSSVSRLMPSVLTMAYIYKKVDAALRGNIGVEIEAMLEASKRNIAVLAPAFPTTQRTVINGQLLLRGMPIHETEFSKDPLHPILTSDIVTVVSRTSSYAVQRLPLSTIRAGIDAIRDFLIWDSPIPRIYVADTESDPDLALLASAVGPSRSVLPCGSGGFANALATVWVANRPMADVSLPPKCDKILIAIGSAHPSSRRQFAYLQGHRNVYTTRVSPEAIIGDVTPLLESVTRGILAANESIVAVMLGDERVMSQDPKRLTAGLARVSRQKLVQWLQQDPECRIGVMATGGDTVRSLAEELRAVAVWPQGVLMPGIPWSTLELPDTNIVLVSKAGSFGSEDTVASIARWMIASG